MEKTAKAVILLVDDRPANIVVLENLLAAEDRIILQASNGQDALKTLLNKEVDLIILDVQMPEMDGFEVASIIKSNKRTKDIPIIFASAERKEHSFMVKAYEEGAVDYLFKPLDPDIARAKVSVLLKLQMQKKELVEKNNSLQKSALLINNSADIIGIVDMATLKVEEINRAFTDMLGYQPEEVIGVPLVFFLGEEDREQISELKKKKEGQLSFETRISCKDGSVKWLHWKVVIKEDKWYVNAGDITRQKKADEEIRKLNADLQGNLAQLEVSNKELESFSYSVSHDLRAPLRALSGFSRIIEEDYGPTLNEDASRLLKNISINAHKMNVLVDDLLEFSRLGRKEVQKQDIDTQTMVHNVLQEIKKITSHRAEVKIPQLPAVYGDQTLINQVWINLLSNAIKYSAKKEHPLVEIGVSESERHLHFYIKDNGAGFDMKYVSKLFGVFQRLHANEEFAGTGVGLAIVQRIINRHGGKIWAEAKPGEGATFFFDLPKK